MSARLLAAAQAYGKAAADYSLAHDAWSKAYPDEARAHYALPRVEGRRFVVLVEPFIVAMLAAEKELHGAAREIYDGAADPMDMPCCPEIAS